MLHSDKQETLQTVGPTAGLLGPGMPVATQKSIHVLWSPQLNQVGGSFEEVEILSTNTERGTAPRKDESNLLDTGRIVPGLRAMEREGKRRAMKIITKG